jgi:DNA-binding IscR family transcriptional regulator
VGLKDIAEKIDSPEAFTAKFYKYFSKNNIIHSIKGVGGGLKSLKSMNQIKLIQIVSIDGDRVYTGG